MLSNFNAKQLPDADKVFVVQYWEAIEENTVMANRDVEVVVMDNEEDTIPTYTASIMVSLDMWHTITFS